LGSGPCAKAKLRVFRRLQPVAAIFSQHFSCIKDGTGLWL
jgi:hypothetical protein